MKIPLPTAAILASLSVELVGERRFVEPGEYYLAESAGEFTMTVIQASSQLNEPRWIVTQSKRTFDLNCTTKVTIPTSASDDVLAEVGGSAPTTQRHTVADIKKLAKALSLPSNFHGNALKFADDAQVEIGCQKILVSKIIELADRLPSQ